MPGDSSFIRFLRTAPGISPDEIALIEHHFRTVTIKAKEYVVREGDVCKMIGYVNKGCLSYYKLLPNGKKSIIHFGFEDWWVGDLQSFLQEQPCTTWWQAIEDSELLAISKINFDQLCEKCPQFKTLFNTKTQVGYAKSMEKAALDKSETAEEKYLRMLRDYPQIIQRVPHYDIASYLGIAPESLSRIRNKLALQK